MRFIPKFALLVLFPLILSIGIIPPLSLTANAEYIEKFSLPYVLDPLTEPQIKECESIHDDFVSLSDSDFYKRYELNSISGNCVMLFEDSLWNYESSDRYDRLSERSAELTQERESELKQTRGVFYIETKSLIELQIPGTFLFKFNGCTGDQHIDAADISVVSDRESVLLTKFVGETREIPPGVCNVLETQIRANDPNSIKIVIPSLDVEIPAKIVESKDKMETMEISSPRKQMQEGVAAQDVVCKSGLALMIRSSGNAACVTPPTAEKLSNAGWGTIEKEATMMEETEHEVLSYEEAKMISEDAYIFGFSLVMMELTKYKMSNFAEAGPANAPINQFSHWPEFPSADFRDVVRPNADTLYSMAWLDLSDEPLVMHLPDTDDRYYLFPIMDGYSNVFTSPGKRTTGTGENNFVISFLITL